MEGACVRDSVLMGDTVIEAGADVSYAILDTGVRIGAGATVGKEREKAQGIAVIGEDVTVPAGATVADGAMIAEYQA